MYYSKIKLDIIYDCFVGINGGNRKSVGIFIDMENKSPINFLLPPNNPYLIL